MWKTYPDTYYFPHVTQQTEQSWLTERHYPSPRMNPAMLPFATYIGQKEFAHSPIPAPTVRSSDWWENDGAVPTHSQKYPHISGEHPVGGEFGDRTRAGKFKKGQWYYRRESDVDHLDVCISPQPDQIGWQRRFYITLFERLAALKL